MRRARGVVLAMVLLATGAGAEAPVAAPGIAAHQLVDIDHVAFVGTDADACLGNPRFVAGLKAQVMLQIYGAFLFEQAAAVRKGRPPPTTLVPFGAGPQPDWPRLRDLIGGEGALDRLDQAIVDERPALARNRAIVLAGIDDLLRFEELALRLGRAERTRLAAAYWASLPPQGAFHELAQRRLGTGAACYLEKAFHIDDLAIAGRHSMMILSPLGNYWLMFWLRRQADGTEALVRLGLETVRAALASDDAP